MIVLKRPVIIFDVDLIGVACVACLVLLGYVAVGQHIWADRNELIRRQALVAAASTNRDRAVAGLTRVQKEIAQLRQAVDSRAQSAPGPEARAAFLARIAELAIASEIELINVSPQPIVQEDGYLVSDVTLTGRGRSTNFILLLHRVARENPFHTIRQLSLAAGPAEQPEECTISWTHRLYMLPPTLAAADRSRNP